MYIALKSFVNNEYVGKKGKPINIKDEKLASSLKKAGYISDISKQDKKNINKDKEIAELNSTISELNNEISILKKDNEELLLKVKSLETETSETDEPINNSEENNEDLTNDDNNENNEDLADTGKDKNNEKISNNK